MRLLMILSISMGMFLTTPKNDSLATKSSFKNEILNSACNGGLVYDRYENGYYWWKGMRGGAGVRIRVSTTDCNGKVLVISPYQYIGKGKFLALRDCQQILCY